MEKILFDGFGCFVVAKDNKYYIRYDSGHFVPKYSDIEVSLEDAELAMKSADKMGSIIMKYVSTPKDINNCC